jgi:transposase-like protein
VEDLIQDIFLAGLSTRRVGEAVVKLLDTKVSSQTVSNITKRLDKKVREFFRARLLDEYQYLFLDAITLKVRYNLAYHNRKVLVAYGLTLFGQRRLLSFYDCPKSHWIKIRTTNVIERSFREVRRRTRVFSCFSNKESCNRLIYAIVTHLNNKWKEHPLKEFTQFS